MLRRALSSEKFSRSNEIRRQQQKRAKKIDKKIYDFLVVLTFGICSNNSDKCFSSFRFSLHGD